MPERCLRKNGCVRRSKKQHGICKSGVHIGFCFSHTNFLLSVVVKNDRKRLGFSQLRLNGTITFLRESTGSITSKLYYVPTSEFVCTIPNPSLQKLQHEISNFTNKNIIEGETFVCYIRIHRYFKAYLSAR